MKIELTYKVLKVTLVCYYLPYIGKILYNIAQYVSDDYFLWLIKTYADRGSNADTMSNHTSIMSFSQSFFLKV